MSRLFRSTLLAALVGVACGSESSIEPSRPPQKGELTPRPCPSTFAECDGNPATVCETDLASSRTSCGQCNRACGPALACGRGACVPSDSNVQVVAGAFASCVRKASGKVLCWGWNYAGQLGDGTTEDRPSPGPALVEQAAELAFVSSGFCARLFDGGVVCWGHEGRSRPDDKAIVVPQKIDGLGDVVTVASFGEPYAPFGVPEPTRCALRTDGSVACWGSNACGNFGTGSLKPENASTPILSLARDVVAVGVGDGVCAAHRDGAVSCWGRWTSLGEGGPPERLICDFGAGRLVPGDVPGVRDAVQIVGAAAGGICVLHAGGTVSCWGRWNRSGQRTTYPSPDLDAQTPQTVQGLTDAIQIRAGFFHSCGLRSNGTVACWGTHGDYKSYHTGPGTHPDGSAQLVEGLDDIVDLSVGAQHSCALRSSGQVVCWGTNIHGELGGPTADKFSTALVRVNGLD
jgi:hypothetical protein